MFLIRESSMYSVGYVTVFLYLTSVTFFIFGVCIPEFTMAGVIFAALFFVVSSIILGIMAKQRIGT